MLQTNFIPEYKNYQTRATAGGGRHLSPSQKFGLLIEKWVTSEITHLGHPARLVSDFIASYDIRLDSGLKVEVKAAKPTRQYTGRAWRDRWQFKLTGGLDYLKEDHLFILVAVDWNGELYPYIVPSAHVGSRSTLCITSHPLRYGGWLKSYLYAWHFIDVVANWRYRLTAARAGQLSIFDEVQQ